RTDDPRASGGPGTDGTSDERVRGADAARTRARPGARWRDRRTVELALDLFHQPPHRRSRGARRAAPAPRGETAARASARLARAGPALTGDRPLPVRARAGGKRG